MEEKDETVPEPKVKGGKKDGKETKKRTNKDDDDDDDDNEEEEEEDEEVVFGLPEQQKFKPSITPEEAEKLSLLLDSFSEEQTNRYEAYRRAGFPRPAMRRVMQSLVGSKPPNSAVIVMSGIAKIYCGEVVEKARSVQEEWKETGPLRPKHIREAVRRLKKQGPDLVTGTARPRLFRV